MGPALLFFSVEASGLLVLPEPDVEPVGLLPVLPELVEDAGGAV